MIYCGVGGFFLDPSIYALIHCIDDPLGRRFFYSSLRGYNRRCVGRLSRRFSDGRCVVRRLIRAARNAGRFFDTSADSPHMIDYPPSARNPPANRRINASANKRFRKSAKRPMGPSRHQPVTDSINHAANQLTDASINHSIISQSTNQCIHGSTPSLDQAKNPSTYE